MNWFEMFLGFRLKNRYGCRDTKLMICVFTANVFQTDLYVDLFPPTCKCFESFLDLISFK